MVYCMADIHGEIDRFKAMLSLIEFSSDDTLYILGDVIDRYPGGVEILKMIMDTPNMVMLLGNHEQMCLDTLGPSGLWTAKGLWLGNGGEDTYHELVDICSQEERDRIIRFLSELPDHLDIEVNGKNYHLVHAAPADDPRDRIWMRSDPDAPLYFEDRTVIVGHTPTNYMPGYQDGPFSIWHGNGIINIDCGCGNKTEQRRLACLRLDDLKEFYV